MAGPLLALGLIACPLLAWSVLRRLGVDREGAGARRRRAANRFLAFALLGYALLAVLPSTEVVPWPVYLLLPPGAAALVELLAKEGKGARAAAVALGVLGLLLAAGYAAAASTGRHWTGDPWRSRFRIGGLAPDGAPTLTRWLLSGGGYSRCFEDATEFPPGWLDEQPFVREDPASAALLGPPGRVTAPRPLFAWHTPLSGLWEVREEPVRYWYPGGPLSVGVHRIEVRPAAE